MQPTPFRVLPAPLEAQRFLIRARQYRAQAIRLVDMENGEPNWPKYFLMTHAIELAIHAYLSFEKGLGRPRTRGGKKLDTHDLMSLYEEAVRRGLKSNALVLQDLPHLSELHKIHYARYPQIEVRPVALIGQFDDMTDQLFADVQAAVGALGR
ncbi:MAG TPA: hypothetical protein VG986_13980 [Pseudolabrys sp.]|nr:hypothetical protein [Pseudolabrys sp.]